MDNLLCDELLQEIFQKLPPCSSSSVSLVSKRWLHLYRTSKTSLSLRLSLNNPTTLQSLSSLLSHYPFLSSLSLLIPPETATTKTTTTTAFSDHLLLLVSSLCPHLHGLRFLAGPVSLSSLLSLSKACTHLTSLSINLSRPLFLNWLPNFPSLKELSIWVRPEIEVNTTDYLFFYPEDEDCPDSELGLESLCLSGIRVGDWGLGWLWRSCNKLRKLQLRSCEGLGDGGAFSSFATCLKGIQEVELRTCRTIVDGVLLKLAENCESLESLLVYDGGSKEGLLRFFSECRCQLRKLDLRLPLDLKNDHLFAASLSFRTLSSLRLQSCCLVSGEGLKAFGAAMSSGLEELALVNCDVVEREPGLLATLGQNLKQLRKLDLSYNEMLVDKEFVSMLVSCHFLVDLKLRGCKGLTSSAMVTMSRSCKRLESVDIMYCCGIEAEGIELFVLNSPKLRRVQVEQSKLSDAAKAWASRKFIEVA